MPESKNKLRFRQFLLLALLLVCLMGLFFSLYNALIEANAKIPFTAIVFVVISFAIIYLIYLSYIRISNFADNLLVEIEAYKISKRQVVEEVVSETVDIQITEDSIDCSEEAKTLIPSEEFDYQEVFFESLLTNIAKKHEVVQGIVFRKSDETGLYSFSAGYAFFSETQPASFSEGETLPGQVAKNKDVLVTDKIPDGYIVVLSGLGKGSPNHLLIAPIIHNNECTGIIELASFKAFSNHFVKTIQVLGQLIDEQLISKESNQEQYGNS